MIDLNKIDEALLQFGLEDRTEGDIERYFKERGMDVTKRNSSNQSLRYNEGKLDWTLIHFKSLEPMVRVMMFGAEKYEPDNWKKPTDLKTLKQSLMRHATALIDGEELDSESNLPHAAHIMCNCMMYLYHKNHDQRSEKG